MGNLTASLSLSLCLTRGLDTGFGVPEYVECTRTGARSACNQNVEQAFLDLTRDIKKNMGAKALQSAPNAGTANLKPGQNIAAGSKDGCAC